MEEKYIDVAGVRTRYLEAGQGEPLVLVHGGGYASHPNANAWDMVMDGFADKGFHVFAPDKIGAGFSDHPTRDEDYVIDTSVSHLLAFFDAIGIDAAHIAGHSRGGYTVTRTAIDAAPRVKTLIVVASGSMITEHNPIYDEWAKEAAKINDPREQCRYMISTNSYDKSHVTEDYVDLHLRILNLPATVAAKQRMQAGGTKRFAADLQRRRDDAEAQILAGALKNTPTLVVWGQNDPSATFDEACIGALELYLPNCAKPEAHIFAEAGHYTFREHAERFIDVVGNYIVARSLAI
jgi:pimeloyl-ACP methyl ester carboxylesterase